MTRVIGVDFGTSRSYFCKCPTDNLKPESIVFGGTKPGLATAVLHQDGQQPLIGDVALEEWGDMTTEQRQRCRLRTHFKPHIADSSEARQDAVMFLTGARSHLRRIHPDDDLQFTFGVPGEADERFRTALQDIAREAGYGHVTIKPEPLGALYWHVDEGSIGLDQAEDGILVVDFGGGTCDFAYMSHLKIQHSWGSMSFGGRLFDDLFFQWFLDENPGVLDRLSESGDEYFVHWHLCRQAKELFSCVMSQNRYGDVVKTIGNYGRMQSMTWGQFLVRASEYRPSSQFRELLQHCGEPDQELAGSIDLLKKLQSLLNKGLDEMRSARVDRVILTGGSSQWPFVREIVCNVLGIESSDVILGADPNRAIGTGLAIHPALMEAYRARAAKLRREMPAVLSDRISPIVDQWVSKTAGAISEDASLQLYDGRVKPALQRLACGGQSAASAQEEIDQQISAFDPVMKEIVATHTAALNKVVPKKVRDEVVDWLDESGLTYAAPRIGKVTVPDVIISPPGVRVPNVWLICLSIVLPFVFLVLPLWRWGFAGGLRGGLFTIPILGVLWLRGSNWISRWPVPRELTVIRRKFAVGRWLFSEDRIRRILGRAKARLHARLNTEMSTAAEDPKARCAEALERLVDRIERIVDE